MSPVHFGHVAVGRWINRVDDPATLIHLATARLDRLGVPPAAPARSVAWWDWRTSLRDSEELWHATAAEDPPWGWVPG